MPAPVVPDWVGAATQAVQRPPGKAYQIQLPSGQQMQAMQEQFFQSIVQQLMQVIDGYILPGQQPTNQLIDWSTAVNTATTNWTTLFEELGLPANTATELADWLTGVNTSAATGNTGWQWIVDQFNQLAYGNSTTNNPMTSITAAVQALLSDIPATSITSASKSLQLVSDFPTAASIVAGAGWSYDATNGLYAAGCAQCAADGAEHTLYGNWIPVNEGDVMSPQAYAAWEGLASTGNPIALNLRTDTGVVDLVESITAPGANSSTYPGALAGAAGSSHWVELSGTYTVPAGVAFVRSELYVGANATAGTVHFDNAPDYRSTSWLTSQLDGINADIGDIYQAFTTGNQAELTAAWSNLMGLLGSNATAMKTGSGPSSNAFWTAIVNDFLNPLNALEVQANNIVGQINQSVVSGLTALWNSWTGTTTPAPTTKLLAGSVAPVLGGSSLAADLTGVNNTVGTQSNWWQQMLTSLGLGGGASTGTNIGGAISTAQSTASSASTAASANTGNINNTWSWIFGTTTPSSASTVLPTKVGQALGGLTLQNDLANLATALGMGSTVTSSSKVNANSITQALNQGSLGADIAALGRLFFPSSPTTVGTAVAASALPNIAAGTGAGQSADLLTHMQNVASVNGGQGTTALAAALQSMQLLAGTVNGLSAKIQQQQTQAAGASNSGQAFQIYFANYATWSQVPVTTTYGNIPGAGAHGSGHFIIDSSGRAAWSPANDGDVSGFCLYNNGGSGQAYTDSDYQELQASLGGLPNGGNAKNFGVLRSNLGGTDYVFGDVFLQTDFTLHYELGCYIGGTRYVWATGPVNTINLNFTFIAGVGNAPDRYQGYSGNTLVFDHTNTSSDPGGLFPRNASHRYWGFRSDTYNNGQNYPGPATYVGCADNSPPTIPGSGIRLYRTQTSSVTETLGLNTVYTTWGDGTNPFFDAVSEQSQDMTVLSNVTIGSFNSSNPVGGNSGVQVANAGRYNVAGRVDIGAANTSAGAVSMCLAVLRYNSAGALQETKLMPQPAFFVNGFGGQYNTGFAGGSVTIGCQAGDILQLGHYLDPGTSGTGRNGAGTLSTLSFTGEATGSHSYMDVTLANWSFN